MAQLRMALSAISEACPICWTLGAKAYHDGQCPKIRSKCGKCGGGDHKQKKCELEKRQEGHCYFCGLPWSVAEELGHEAGEKGCKMEEMTRAIMVMWWEKKILKEVKEIQEVWRELGRDGGKKWIEIVRERC